MNYLKIIFYLFFNTFLISQSRVGDWKSYPSSIDIRQSLVIDQKIISATSGGILIFDKDSSSFNLITNINGLVETDLNSIDVDVNGHIWIGSNSPNGVVQIYDYKNLRSIKVFDFDVWEISSISISDSNSFVSYSKDGEWGIMEFFLDEKNYNYKQIFNPSENQLEFIYDIEIINDEIYAGSNIGLFKGNFIEYILNYPTNWTTFTNYSNKLVKKILNKNDIIYVLSENEIFSLDENGVLQKNIFSYEDISVIDFIIDVNEKKYIVSKWKLYETNKNGKILNSWQIKYEPNSITEIDDENLIISSKSGLGIFNKINEKFKWYTPNSPYSNVYTSMVVLDDGRLFAAGPTGFSVLDEDGWYNLITSQEKWSIRNHSADEFNFFVSDSSQYISSRVWSVLEDSNGVWISNQGVFPINDEFKNPISGGVIFMPLDNPGGMVVFDTTSINPTNSLGYMNVRGLNIDKRGNIWASNFGSLDPDKKIIVFDRNEYNKNNLFFWHSINQSGLGSNFNILDNPTDIMFANENTALIGSSKDDGLFILKYNLDSDNDGIPDAIDIDSDSDGIPDIDDWDDDGDNIPDNQDIISVDWNNFSTLNGLEDNTIWSLAKTNETNYWILTSKGLQQIYFNNDFSEITPFYFTYFSGVSFGEGSKVIPDVKNNLWISSIDKGLYVLLNNGVPWPDWYGFRKDNSMLLSDEVTSIAIDNKRGIAYIATSKGINSLRIPFAESKLNFSKIKIFPSPYIIPSELPMVIDGLMDESSIKIITLSGDIIKNINFSTDDNSGYQAFWDGKNDNGQYVSSGIYLVVMYSKNGKSSVEKIAIIREQ